jgi:hypothetical protein
VQPPNIDAAIMVFADTLSGMSDDTPKSAIELAMERFRRQDAEDGDLQVLTDAQKADIAEVRRVYAARLAQAEILHTSALASLWEPEARQKADAEYRRDTERLAEERDRKIEAIRKG